MPPESDPGERFPVREDLQTASRSLGLAQRFLLREQLGRLESLLGPAETMQALAPAWWRGHRSLAVVTTSRLLLVRRELRCSSRNQASFPLRVISQLSVHAAPPHGARFRLAVGLDLEEFSTTGLATELEQSLRAALP